MPLYEYRCKDCTHTFEKLVAASAAGEGQECPECESRNSLRLLSTFAARGGGEASPAPRGGARPAGGGGCGSGCGCH